MRACRFRLRGKAGANVSYSVTRSFSRSRYVAALRLPAGLLTTNPARHLTPYLRNQYIGESTVARYPKFLLCQPDIAPCACPCATWRLASASRTSR